MADRVRRSTDGARRRAFLRVPVDPAAPVLLEGEAEHVSKVLRLGVGDTLEGLDGRGGRFPLEITAADRRAIQVRCGGAPLVEPPPGDPRAPLPHLAVATAWPKGPRAEAMLQRLTQLGAASIRPLDCERGGPQEAGSKRERAERVLREACKQSERAWLPELRSPCRPDELAALHPGDALVVLDPGAELSLATWARAWLADPARRPLWGGAIALAVGPEGGFSDGEREALLRAGASPVVLAPHVLRIETAAEAAVAVLAAACL